MKIFPLSEYRELLRLILGMIYGMMIAEKTKMEGEKPTMGKVFWEGSVLLAPVPPALVTCGTVEQPNILTIGWTGILCTHPPMTYISVRPSRYSYGLIRESGCFAVNLPTASLVRAVDFCGVKSGEKVNKFKECGLHALPAQRISAPILEECPISLECRVTEVRPLGTHDMFLAEIVGVNADERFLDENGRLDLEKSGLLAYAHGEYFALGKKLGSFGYSVRRRKPKTGGAEHRRRKK